MQLVLNLLEFIWICSYSHKFLLFNRFEKKVSQTNLRTEGRIKSFIELLFASENMTINPLIPSPGASKAVPRLQERRERNKKIDTRQSKDRYFYYARTNLQLVDSFVPMERNYPIPPVDVPVMSNDHRAASIILYSSSAITSIVEEVITKMFLSPVGVAVMSNDLCAASVILYSSSGITSIVVEIIRKLSLSPVGIAK